MNIVLGVELREDGNWYLLDGSNREPMKWTAEELEICERVIELLPDSFNREDFVIEKRTESYSTIFYKKHCNDFFRVKYSMRSIWFSIDASDRIRAELVDSPIFEAQKKKTQRHWKCKVNSVDEIYDHIDLIAECIHEPYECE